jgi:hypothetical protein
MKRLLAVIGLAAFLAACADSNMVSPGSRAAPGSALHSPGDPPPPPLSGDDGSGLLSVGISSDVVPNAQPIILVCSHPFSLQFSWSYLQSTSSSNQVVHLDLTGSSSGNIDLHDIQNGKIITHGTVSDADDSFTIQGTNFLNLSADGFNAEVTGTLTTLTGPTAGTTCQATAELSGTFVPVVPS